MNRFEGKIALVSGVAGGIGAAIADRLAEEGAAVVRSDLNPPTGGVTCDVTDASACAAAIARAVDDHGRLDVLVNAAGIIISGRIGALDPEDWRQVIEVNLTGTFLLSQAAVAALVESKGVIVNVASLAGLSATPYNAAYNASKGGVIMLTKSMAIELSREGVRVNAVCPGAVDTPFIGRFVLPDDGDMDLVMRSASPMGRLIPPAEVAGAVAYLASDDAANVSGTTLVIDGAASA